MPQAQGPPTRCRSVQVNTEPVVVPWYAPDGSRNLCRHAVNGRQQETVVESYCKRILDVGIVQGCRGDAWTVEGDEKGGPKELLTFASTHPHEPGLRALALRSWQG